MEAAAKQTGVSQVVTGGSQPALKNHTENTASSSPVSMPLELGHLVVCNLGTVKYLAVFPIFKISIFDFQEIFTSYNDFSFPLDFVNCFYKLYARI